MMTTSDQAHLMNQSIEADPVFRWRRNALCGAGYTEEQANQLARDHQIDLHDAVDLVRRGCPPGVAVKILS
jgi:hypothetical protein